MTEKKVTTLEEIKKQAAPDVVEIPGFKLGTTINVAVRLIDLTPYLLELDIGNPLYEAAVMKAKLGEDKKAVAEAVQKEALQSGIDLKKVLPVLDAVAKEALVEPRYEEIISIAPLTLEQKMAIFNYAIGDVDGLSSFRSQ